MALIHNLPKTVNAGNYETGKDMCSWVACPLVRSLRLCCENCHEIKESAAKIKG